MLPRDLHLHQLCQSVSLILQRYDIWKPRFPLRAGSYRYCRITHDKDAKKRSQPCDYVSRSMQNLSAIHFTMWGGSTLMPGFSPIRVSSLRYGRHQFISVLTVTPALSANCCFVIAFIMSYCFQLLAQPKDASPCEELSYFRCPNAILTMPKHHTC